MAGLISDQLISNLRNVAYRQLVTDVVIQRPTKVQTDYGMTETFATVATTTGWLKEIRPGTLSSIGERIVAIGVYELRLRWGTDIESGDKVLIGDGEYIVQDANHDATISLFLKALLRKEE